MRRLCRSISPKKPRDESDATISRKSDGDATPSRENDDAGETRGASFGDISLRDCPCIFFDAQLNEYRVHDGEVKNGNVTWRAEPHVRVRQPILMSPAYAGFAIDPDEWRYLHYDDVGIVFRRERGGTFMAPSVDTVVCCAAVRELYSRSDVQIPARIVEAGCGCALLLKYAVWHSPADVVEALAVDLDAAAIRYAQSDGCSMPQRTLRGAPVRWDFVAGDAVAVLEKEAAATPDERALVLANPPYIPSMREVSGESESCGRSFWEGTAFLVAVVDYPGPSVVCLSSLSLVARSVRDALARRRFTVLAEREVAWKAWYAGGATEHLVKRADETVEMGGKSFAFGACKRPRSKHPSDGRDRDWSLHWHFIYLLYLHPLTGSENE